MKKKLLFINGHLNPGGCERSLVDVLQHIDYSLFDVDLLLLEDTGDYLREVPDCVNVIFFDIHNTYGSFIKVVKNCLLKKDFKNLCIRILMNLRKLIGNRALKPIASIVMGKHQYDCVIGFRPGFVSDLTAFSVKAEKKISWWHHGEWLGDEAQYRNMASKVDCIVAVSESCVSMLQTKFPEVSDKIICIPNMIDTKNVMEKSFGSPYDDKHFHIVSVGRLSPEKHFQDIIPVAKYLRDVGIDYIWHLVGDGPERDLIKERISKDNLTDTILLEGQKDNPYPFVRYADLFVHPSHVESQGLVVLEALTLGVPVVVTKSNGPAEFIIDHFNGLLCEKTNQSLTENVYNIITDVELYSLIKSNSTCPVQYLSDVLSKKINERIQYLL